MEPDPKIQAMQSRQDANVYIRQWKVGLMKTCPASPGFCCYAMCCGQCASYGLRKQALHGDMTRYLCCNGSCPCSGRMGEKSCPEFCLCLEVCCCFANSVAVTRWMIQDELRIVTSKCDNCLIGTMIVLQYVACICHIVACITGNEDIIMAARIIDLIADIVWCTVCACMQTQHKIELENRDTNPGAYGAPMAAPGVQMIPVGGAEASRAYPAPGQAPPPGYGYPPPPPGYGAPPPGYGAPPPGYGAPPPPGYGAPPPPGYAPPPPGYAPPPPGYAYPPQPGYAPQGYPPQQQMYK
eukprot:CAMPEP_0202900824 /NCGR_PEP_ID=MMETSP1392-20130828/12054_1 /ASSEMBLY_ACC=CAM_ASM_000868 /TAXON_ID=225041 /ORGANISM="Chlamydomonas chlamydogama, Strain SAG 11-48b" /LENGTH=295 /DNA_ID=CAMNT_0049587273 /DNA_START=146 /DNA_END=1033 /DNA_ORIENTATION=-